MDPVFRLCYVKKQKLQQQGAAQFPALNLEVGKAHGQVNIMDIPGADKPGIFHCPGEPVTLLAAGGGAAVVGAGKPQIFPADVFVAGFPLPAAEPAALIAEKFHLGFFAGERALNFSNALFSRKSGTTYRNSDRLSSF